MGTPGNKKKEEMYNITLLSSFHKILGKCDPDELYKIIEEVQPDIIFEELSLDTFSLVYTDGFIPKTVEAITIKKYVRNYDVRHFHVDTYPLKKGDLYSGAEKIAKKSNEYIELWNERASRTIKNGYNFL